MQITLSWSIFDYSVDQLLPIIHNIYTASDIYPILESWGVSLDMSKDFDKVWQTYFQIKSMGISHILQGLFLEVFWETGSR